MTTSPQLLDPALPGLCIAQPARAERFFVEGDRVRVGGHQTRGGGQVLFCGKNGEARITAAADLLDALVSDRSYKAAWSFERALDEVSRRGGSQLDPGVVEAIRRADVEQRLRAILEG